MESELSKPAEVPGWARRQAEAFRRFAESKDTSVEASDEEVTESVARFLASTGPAADLDRLAERIVEDVVHEGSVGLWRGNACDNMGAMLIRRTEVERVRALLAESIRHEAQPDMAEVREVLGRCRYLLTMRGFSTDDEVELAAIEEQEARIDALLAKLGGGK